jgi:hypothetical protein
MNMSRRNAQIPSHRKDAVTWSSEREALRRLGKPQRCHHCRKRALRTKADARTLIGLVIRRAPLWDDYQLKPYRCPYGNGWHIGHDRKLATLLRKGKR